MAAITLASVLLAEDYASLITINERNEMSTRIDEFSNVRQFLTILNVYLNIINTANLAVASVDYDLENNTTKIKFKLVEDE